MSPQPLPPAATEGAGEGTTSSARRDDAADSRTVAPDAGLVDLAFGSLDSNGETGSELRAGTHLAWQPNTVLDLDLGDEALRRFGDFELVQRIGSGGMGVVYRAYQVSLKREVAIKLLATSPWAPGDFLEHFRREAQHAARMQHPNIVTVHGMGEHGEFLYYAMQLVDGPSLAEALERGPPPGPLEAARCVLTLAEATGYAHRLGILHLDLKPANILIAPSGEPLIADFGLARRLDQVLPGDAHRIAGTPSYMAPEQASREHLAAIGPATDIYGLGAILHELLSGSPPCQGDSPHATLERVRAGDIAPVGVAGRPVPADLEAICLRCLSTQPQRRYASARALADDLERFLDNRPVSARTPGRSERMRRWAQRNTGLAGALAGAMLALCAGIIATSVQWRRAEDNAMAASERLWEGRREAALRLEMDGRGDEAIPRLLENIDELSRAGNAHAIDVEQRRIGLLTGQGAVLIDHVVIADANPMAVAISPDGQTLGLALNDLSVRWYDTATLTERGRVALAGVPTSDRQARPPFLLRFIDERRLRVTLEWFSNYASPTDGDSWLVDLDARAIITPPTTFRGFTDMAWSSNARFAALRNDRHEVELWQSDPWRAVSRAAPAQRQPLPWLVDPRGRFLASLTLAMRGLVLYDSGDMANPQAIDTATDSGFSAWALSDDGDTLVLGDFEGRVFLVDTRSRRVRNLSTARGREITWITFSEDGAWLAIGNFDGSVHAFDKASGQALTSGPIHNDFVVRRVGISRSERMLVAQGDGRVALWRIALPGPRSTPAQRIGAGPAPHGLSGRHAVGWSLERRLLASAGMDGQVRLWRLPAAPMRSARAAAQVPETLSFGGRLLVDVAWNRLRLVDPEGTPRSAWLELPDPPGFAELVDADRMLVVTLGASLQRYETSTLSPLGPAVGLPDTPQHLLASPDGRRLVLGFGQTRAEGASELLRAYALPAGTLLGEARLPGPLRQLAMSADGARIAAVGAPTQSTHVLDAASLDLLGDYPHDPYEPVQWATFPRRGDELLMATRTPDRRLGENQLIRWTPTRDRVGDVHATGWIWPLGVIDTPAATVIAGDAGDIALGRHGELRVLTRLARSEPTAALATSADGSMLARAYRREVQLYDARSMSPIGAPLQADIDGIDVIMRVAFAPDDTRLLARTIEGRWLVWPIAPDTRSSAELGREIARLAVANESQSMVAALLPRERALLRSRDVGQHVIAGEAPRPAIAAWTADGHAVPARGTGTPENLLDLSHLYDFAPDSVRNTFYNVQPMLRPVPAGVQRIDGIDFDIRGIVQLGAVADRRDAATLRSLHCLEVPSMPIAAFHLLLRMSVAVPAPTGTVLAELRLHYADGGEVAVPLRAGIDLPGFAGDDQLVPVAFGNPAMTMIGVDDGDILSHPRVGHPAPGRALRCIDLSATPAGGPIALFAISVESVADRPAASSRPPDHVVDGR